MQPHFPLAAVVAADELKLALCLAAIDPARALFGALETVISLGLFCSALLYVRWKFQHDRKLAGE
mgnify:CR=1 FL=1